MVGAGFSLQVQSNSVASSRGKWAWQRRLSSALCAGARRTQAGCVLLMLWSLLIIGEEAGCTSGVQSARSLPGAASARFTAAYAGRHVGVLQRSCACSSFRTTACQHSESTLEAGLSCSLILILLGCAESLQSLSLPRYGAYACG